jgi:NitT/TauT family transport system substrate-binding protein
MFSRRDLLTRLGATAIGLLAAACAPTPQPPAPTAAPAPPLTSGPAPTTPAPTAAPAPIVAPTSAATTEAIKIVYTQPAAAFMALWIATDQGLFKKYGLANADVTRVAPPSDIQGLLSGEVHFSVDGSSGVAAAARGADLTYIGSNVPYYAQALYADPSIETLADLVGKSVGATTQGGSSDNALRTLLATRGVDASGINVVYLRDDAGILAAVQSRVVQAAMMTSPNTLRAGQAGYKELQNLVPLHLKTINQGMLVRKSWAAQHEEAVLAFLQGMMEGAQQAKSNPDLAKATISKFTQLEDPAQLDDSYKTASASMVIYPILSDAHVQNVLDTAVEPEIKTHKPSEFYDNTYVQKLEPFARSLYPYGVIPDE